MRRRDLLKVIGGAAAVRPLMAYAQNRVPTVGILWHAGSAEEEGVYLTQIQQGFRLLVMPKVVISMW